MTSTVDFLESYIIQSVKQGLKKYGRDDTFVIDKVALDQVGVESFSDHMSIILLWSTVGSMTLKAHFTLKAAKSLTAKVLEKKPEEISDQSAMDFMREFNNIIGGRLRGDFEKNQILIGMSLPFLTKGSDEVVFRNIRDPRSKCRVWQVSNKDSVIIFSTEICIVEPSPIDEVRESLQKELDATEGDNSGSSGDVEFF